MWRFHGASASASAAVSPRIVLRRSQRWPRIGWNGGSHWRWWTSSKQQSQRPSERTGMIAPARFGGPSQAVRASMLMRMKWSQ